MPAAAGATSPRETVARARHRTSTACAAATRPRFGLRAPLAIELSVFSSILSYYTGDTRAIRLPGLGPGRVRLREHDHVVGGGTLVTVPSPSGSVGDPLRELPRRNRRGPDPKCAVTPRCNQSSDAARRHQPHPQGSVIRLPTGLCRLSEPIVARPAMPGQRGMGVDGGICRYLDVYMSNCLRMRCAVWPAGPGAPGREFQEVQEVQVSLRHRLDVMVYNDRRANLDRIGQGTVTSNRKRFGGEVRSPLACALQAEAFCCPRRGRRRGGVVDDKYQACKG